MSTTLGDVIIKIGLARDKVKSDLAGIEKDVKETGKKIETDFKAHRLEMDTRFAKMNMKELTAMFKILKNTMEQKIKFGASSDSIEKTAISMDVLKEKMAQLKTTSSESTDSIAGGFKKIGGAIVAFFALEKIKSFFESATKEAGKFEEAIEFFKGSAEDMESLRKAVKNTVDDFSLLKLSNQASDLGVNIKEQPILFALAKRAAEAYGTDAEAGFQKVIMATEGIIRGLKAIGIQKKVYEQIVKDLAKAHGGLITEMDAETQKEIRLQAIIKATGITLKEATSGLQSNADKAEAAGVKWDNLKLKIGGVFTSIMGGIASGLGKAIDMLNPQKAILEWNNLSKTVENTDKKIIPLLSRYDDLKNKTNLNTKEHVELNKIIQTITSAFPAAITEWDKYGNAISFSKDKLLELIEAEKLRLQYTNKKAIEETTAEIKKYGEEIEILQQRITKGTYTDPSGAILQWQTSEIEEFNNQIKKNGELIKGAEEQLKRLKGEDISTPKSKTETVGGLTDDAKLKRAEDAKKRAEDYKKQVEETTKLYDGLVGITTGYIEKLKELYNLELIEAEKKFGKDKEAFEKWKANAQKELNEKIALKQREQDILNNPAMLKAKGLEGGLKKSTPKELEKESTPTNEIEKKSYEDLQKESDKATKANESFATSMSSAFSQAFISGQNLGDVFKNIALQLAGMVIQALAFKAIMSVLDIGTGGFFGALFGAQGGTFQNGQKVASFAGGGSFIVPPGYDHDSFRMNVQSGERVQVTPANAVKNDKDYAKNINASLSQIAGNIRAINFNNMERGVYESNKDVVLRVNDREIARASLGGQNDYTNKGKNVGDFRSL